MRQEDEKLLEPGTVEQLSINKKHALIVRLGEKRILRGTMKRLRAQLAKAGASKKRGRDEDKGTKGKKARK